MVLVAALLAGCGGSSPVSSGVPAPQATIAAPGAVAVTVTIKLPPKTKNHARRPLYVGSTTATVTVQGGLQGQSPTASATATCLSGTCTTALNLPTGIDTVSAVLKNISSQVLSQGSTTQMVSPSANTISIAAGGVIARAAITLKTNSLAATFGFSPGSAGTVQLLAAAFDADGNAITGSAPYFNPIVVNNSDTTGVITLSAPQISAPGQNLTVSYNGSTALKSALLTPSVVGVPATNLGAAGVLIRNIYVADANNSLVRVLRPDGSPAPLDPIAAGFSFPQIVYVDAADNLYVGDRTSVRSFAPGSGAVSSTASPPFSQVYTIAQAGSYLYVTDNAGLVNIYNPAFSLTPVLSYSTGFTNARYGALTPTGNLYVPDNTFNIAKVYLPISSAMATYSPLSGFVGFGLTAAGSDAGGNICVADPSGNVWLFPAGSNVASQNITSGINNPSFCAFDAAGNVYSVNYTGHTVTEYTSAGTLIATYATAAGSYGIAFDPSGYLFIADYNGHVVEVYRPPSATLLASFSMGVSSGPIGIAFGR